MSLPNLFVIGAMKSGTTTLHEYLGAHPEIFMSIKKEPAYFVEEYGWANGLDWYKSLFSEAAGQKYMGESSTDYSKLPRFKGVPERIFQLCPDAKFIYLMRDPVERTISHYWWRVRFNNESRSMLDAVQQEPYYRCVSYYALQLRAYFEIFEPKQFKYITFENLIANPQDTCNEIFEWLGLQGRHILPANDVKRMQTPNDIDQIRGEGVINKLRYTRAWEMVSPYVSKKLRNFGKQLACRSVSPKEVDTKELVDWLSPIQRLEVQELTDIVGRQFPEWTTLYPEDR